jgi:hypothetical protein
MMVYGFFTFNLASALDDAAATSHAAYFSAAGAEKAGYEMAVNKKKAANNSFNRLYMGAPIIHLAFFNISFRLPVLLRAFRIFIYGFRFLRYIRLRNKYGILTGGGIYQARVSFSAHSSRHIAG